MGLVDTLFKDATWAQLSLVGLALLVLLNLVKTSIKDAKIRKLGGRAPAKTSYVPFGLDIAYGGVVSLLSNKTLEYFQEGLSTYANPKYPHTMEMSVVGNRVIFTQDDINIKAILATQFTDYGKGPKFNAEWHDFLGDSIFTTDGDKWHNSRQLIRPQFIKDRLSDIEIFEKHCEVLLPLLGGQPGGGQTVDALDLFFRFTLDASTDFLLGRSVDSLKHGQVAFAEAFNEVQHFQSLVARLQDLQHLLPRRKFRKHLKVMNEFVDTYVNQALNLSPADLESKTKGDDGYTFLHALVGHTRDRKVLRDQIVAVLLAGRDTTACTLSWLFYELSTKPEQVKKLRSEILSVVGKTDKPTYENLKSMKYLTACINETLRIYPIVPFNVRVALKDTTLPQGAGPDGKQPVGVLAGTPIGYSTLTMQRRHDLYPGPETGFPNPDLFVPERWATWHPKSWTYIPFNGGPRICIGQQFALTEMQYTVVRIFQKFARLENRMSGPAEYRADIVLQPAHGVTMAFWEDEKA